MAEGGGCDTFQLEGRVERKGQMNYELNLSINSIALCGRKDACHSSQIMDTHQVTETAFLPLLSALSQKQQDSWHI